jgi:transcriptional regulator with XRE-family HTH domain
MSLGDNIRTIRKAKGVTISDLSSITGVSRSTITDIENDKGRGPTITTLKKIADALGVSVDDFFKEEAALSIEENEKNAIPEGYLRVSKEALEKGVSPEDMQMAVDFFIRARQRDEKAKRSEDKQ